LHDDTCSFRSQERLLCRSHAARETVGEDQHALLRCRVERCKHAAGKVEAFIDECAPIRDVGALRCELARKISGVVRKVGDLAHLSTAAHP
jgi:hypothetical protein